MEQHQSPSHFISLKHLQRRSWALRCQNGSRRPPRRGPLKWIYVNLWKNGQESMTYYITKRLKKKTEKFVWWRWQIVDWYYLYITMANINQKQHGSILKRRIVLSQLRPFTASRLFHPQFSNKGLRFSYKKKDESPGICLPNEWIIVEAWHSIAACGPSF